MSFTRESNPGQVLPKDADQALSLLSRQKGILGDFLTQLRDENAHGNRVLHLDQLFLGLLCAFFDPLARSLRTIEGHGNFGGALDLNRLARSTMADAMARCDAKRLRPIIKFLLKRVPHLPKADADLECITREIVAADGTYLTTLADVGWALHHTKRDGTTQAQVRANVQINTESWAPQVVSISGDDKKHEADSFIPDLLSGVLYVVDRNFVNFDFLKAVLAKDNDFVLRVRTNAPAAKTLLERPLCPKDIEQSVISDESVELTGDDAPTGVFRRVKIQTTDREGKPHIMILLTNLVSDEIAAHVIGTIYRQRWQIELFFKWLKTSARMDHLLSTTPNGILLQLYATLIGSLLMLVQSGRRMSVYTLIVFRRLAHGQCSIAEANEILDRFERERQLNNTRAAKKRAAKKLV